MSGQEVPSIMQAAQLQSPALLGGLVRDSELGTAEKK
jgi:hypothetical protein